MNFQESEEHSAIRSAVAAICESFGDNYYRTLIAEGRSPTALWEALGKSGFVGINLPEEYGGGGAGITELALVCEEAAASGNPLLLLLVSSAISGEILKAHGTPEQKSLWLPAMAAGTDKMVFAITEADAGSNTHRITTRAVKDGPTWVLRGDKQFISGVDEASWMLVVARTNSLKDERAELTLFVVDTDALGLSRSRIPIEAQMPENQFSLTFEDVRLDDSRRVGEVGAGLRLLFHGLNPERIMTAAIENGIGRHALAAASSYAVSRSVWGVPIGAHQGLAHPMAEAAIDVELARLMTAKAAWLHDSGHNAGEASNMAKFAAADAALKALDAAIQTHGGNGMASEYGLAHLWGMARLLRIAPVSREMILNFVSQHTLGLPRSY